jgi:hypothetical protein
LNSFPEGLRYSSSDFFTSFSRLSLQKLIKQLRKYCLFMMFDAGRGEKDDYEEITRGLHP